MTPPLTPEQRAAYGPDWDDVSAAIRERAGQRCECNGECGWPRHVGDMLAHPMPHDSQHYLTGRCRAINGQPSPYTTSLVVLTVAHLDHNGHEGEHDPARLKAMCQGCHLAYDRAHRQQVERP